MNTLSGLDLLTGVVPVSVGSAAAAAALLLLLRRGRSWWMKIASAVSAAALLALGTSWYLVHVAAVSAQALPWPVTGWIGVAFLALLVAGLNMAGTGWRRKIIAPVAMAVLILGAALEVYAYFGTYRTLGDLTGANTAAIQSLPSGSRLVPRTADPSGPGPKTGPLAATWVKPAGLPAAGTINSAQIPGTASGFAARSTQRTRTRRSHTRCQRLRHGQHNVHGFAHRQGRHVPLHRCPRLDQSHPESGS